MQTNLVSNGKKRGRKLKFISTVNMLTLSPFTFSYTTFVYILRSSPKYLCVGLCVSVSVHMCSCLQYIPCKRVRMYTQKPRVCPFVSAGDFHPVGRWSLVGSQSARASPYTLPHHLSTLGLQFAVLHLAFTWSGDRNPGVTIAWQALHPLGRLPSPQ